MLRPNRAILALMILACLAPPRAGATQPCQFRPYETIWKPDGTRVTPPAAEPTRAFVITDPTWGITVLWSDSRGPSATSLYSRRIGSERWDWWPEGRFSFSPGSEATPNVVRAPDRGLLAVWSDDRDDEGDIYVQRITAWGSIWPSFVPGGVPICKAAGRQSHPTAALDGEGGFFVVWVDERLAASTGPDIYIQRFYDFGLAWDGWPQNGVPLCASPGEQRDPVVVSDGAGGALVFFRDAANPADQNLLMARISGSGQTPGGWTNGTPLTNSTADAGQPIVLADPAGGAFVAWQEVTVPGSQPEMGIRVTRVNGAGDPAPGWTLDGISVGTVAGENGAPTLTSDGDGGVFTGWVDAPASASAEAKAARLGGDGTPASGWPPGGRTLGPALSAATSVALFADRGFLFAAWTDPADGGDVRALRLDRTGSAAPFWPAGGAVLTAAPGVQRLDGVRSGEPPSGSIASDGYGGILVFWFDERDGTPAIYGQRISRNGVIAPQVWQQYPCEKSGWIVRAFPVPTRGVVTMEAFAPSDRGLRFDVYDVRGRLRHVTRVGAIPGPAVLPFRLDLSSLEPGVYFVNYEMEGSGGTSHGSRRIVLTR